MTTTVDSSSTLDEVEAEYDDTASYLVDGSVEKARRFEVAVRILIRRVADEKSHGSSRLARRENLRLLQKELEDVRGWLRANDTNRRPRAVHGDMSHFRG